MTNTKLVKLYSKDKNSLRRFIKLLYKINRKWKNLTFISKNIKKRKKKITILKSPHVNKTAQTQYQTIIYGATLKYAPLVVKKSYILLKKIRNHLFPDVKIKIKQVIFTKTTKPQMKNQFSPKKVYYYSNAISFLENQKQKNYLLDFNNCTKGKKTLVKKILQFLKVLDNYGNAT
jgi:ribosomal protein S10